MPDTTHELSILARARDEATPVFRKMGQEGKRATEEIAKGSERAGTGFRRMSQEAQSVGKGGARAFAGLAAGLSTVQGATNSLIGTTSRLGGVLSSALSGGGGPLLALSAITAAIGVLGAAHMEEQKRLSASMERNAALRKRAIEEMDEEAAAVRSLDQVYRAQMEGIDVGTLRAREELQARRVQALHEEALALEKVAALEKLRGMQESPSSFKAFMSDISGTLFGGKLTKADQIQSSLTTQRSLAGAARSRVDDIDRQGGYMRRATREERYAESDRVDDVQRADAREAELAAVKSATELRKKQGQEEQERTKRQTEMNDALKAQLDTIRATTDYERLLAQQAAARRDAERAHLDTGELLKVQAEERAAFQQKAAATAAKERAELEDARRASRTATEEQIQLLSATDAATKRRLEDERQIRDLIADGVTEARALALVAAQHAAETRNVAAAQDEVVKGLESELSLLRAGTDERRQSVAREQELARAQIEGGERALALTREKHKLEDQAAKAARFEGYKTGEGPLARARREKSENARAARMMNHEANQRAEDRENPGKFYGFGAREYDPTGSTMPDRNPIPRSQQRGPDSPNLLSAELRGLGSIPSGGIAQVVGSSGGTEDGGVAGLVKPATDLASNSGEAKAAMQDVAAKTAESAGAAKETALAGTDAAAAQGETTTELRTLGIAFSELTAAARDAGQIVKDLKDDVGRLKEFVGMIGKGP